MAIFKCKMCGGALEINNNESVAVCEYCGTNQTLPKLDDDRKANLYDRANHFRRNNEFDKAMSIYENILNEDKTDAESYWSLVLCRYGIEYVEDPASHKRVPTVNRAQFTSVFDDGNYKSALQYADSVQKSIYEAEAKAINEIQKGILEISQKEEPFDVFICYKETDANGRRTPDSVLATELYHELTKEGFKVFFSRITLEDKLGTAYEPYIFAALNSAKVMVVLGTKSEYFNAVWVKNEWSRYLSLIKSGAKKMLIPAYKDMDPYDLPEEFSHLQAQDMSKLGFMQDLIRGIIKIISADEPKPVAVKETVVSAASTSTNTAPLLKRVFMFLEDGDWNSANEYCEKVLDIEPENASAYLGKLLSELRVRKQELLKDQAKPFDNSNNYQKTVRFADEKLKAELISYVEYIKNRNETARLQDIYSRAKRAMSEANTESAYDKVARLFDSIAEYQDSSVLAKSCYDKAKVARKDAILSEGKAKMSGEIIYDYQSAIKLFKIISGWKDADECIVVCEKKIEEIKAKAEAERLEKERKEELERIESEKRKKQIKKALIIAVSVLIGLIIIIIIINAISDAVKYKDALELAESGKFEEAIVMFEELEDYKDSPEQIELIKQKQEEAEEKAAAEEAAEKKLAEEKAAAEKAKVEKERIASSYNEAMALLDKGEKVKAAILFGSIADYKDAREKSFALWRDLIVPKTIFSEEDHTYAIGNNGKLLFTKYIRYSSNSSIDENVLKKWSNIIAVDESNFHVVGLKSDGTVVAFGDNDAGECNVDNWTDIVDICVDERNTVGLKSDGTVVTAGYISRETDVNNWTDIVAISISDGCLVGLKIDGTVVEAADDDDDINVESWTDIVDISIGGYFNGGGLFIIGLKSDGTVVGNGNNEDGQLNIYNWEDIVEISTGLNYTVGLKSDGTVVAVGDNYSGQCNVGDWRDIVSISAGSGRTIGLKSDGTVVAAGNNDRDSACNVQNLKNIRTPSN